jgi:hypothetical protein
MVLPLHRRTQCPRSHTLKLSSNSRKPKQRLRLM